MICAVLREKTVVLMVKVALKNNADVFEIRLDCLKDLRNLDKLSLIKKPKIATCMPKWEGGFFNGSEKERLKLLSSVLDKVQYATIELNCKPPARAAFIRQAKSRGVKVIVAYHDFKKTPGVKKILQIIRREKKAGADIAKVAFTPKKHSDVLAVMEALASNESGLPVIALSMGERGKISRVVGPLLGSYLTFASVGRGRESASGQLTVGDLKAVLRLLE